MPPQDDVRFGFLSTIDAPLLPFLLASALTHGLRSICVICDSKLQSDKDKRIWQERTGGAFDHVDGRRASIYALAKQRIPFYFVENHNDDDSFALIKALKLGCLLNAGTPRRLSAKVLDSVKHGVVNVHPGLLPKYRGASAVEWAIYNDDRVGNTAHFMSEGYDAGPIITSEWYEFQKEGDYQSIRTKVYRDGVVLAGKVLAKIQQTKMTPQNGIAQDETSARFWKPIPDDKMAVVLKKIEAQAFAYQCL